MHVSEGNVKRTKTSVKRIRQYFNKKRTAFCFIKKKVASPVGLEPTAL